MEPLDPMLEVLLTVWALGQVKGKAPKLCVAFPARLQSALRKARKLGYVVDDQGVYLDDLGSHYLCTHGNPLI